MAYKFYRNSIPQQPVYLSGMGQYAQFDQVSDDTGVLVTGKEQVQKDLATAQANGISGVKEITQQEYNELVELKKKLQPSPPSWREEFSLGQSNNQIKQSVQEAARQPVSEDARVAVVNDNKRIEQTVLPETHRPVVRKRKT